MLHRALLFGLLLPPVAHGSTWDRDTFEVKPADIPAIEDVVVGAFPRFPPEYYQDRLERMTHAIAREPDNLALYDDAAVAADRVGSPEEAIAWMEQKFETMNRLRTLMDSRHRYTRLANLGTFLAHKATRTGKAEEFSVAAQELQRAVDLGPTALFGRERSEQLLTAWLATAPAVEGERDLPSFLGVPPGLRGAERETYLSRHIQGLISLIVLGHAWEDVDVFYALRRAYLLAGDRRAATLVHERIKDMTDEGARSRVNGAGSGEALANRIPATKRVEDDPAVISFSARRTAAKAWQEARFAYMRAAIAQARHPDTHPDFWDAFDHPAPATQQAAQDSAASWCGCRSTPARGLLWMVALVGIRVGLRRRAMPPGR